MSPHQTNDRLCNDKLAQMLADLDSAMPGSWKLYVIGDRPFLCPATKDGTSLLTVVAEDGVQFGAFYKDDDALHAASCAPDTLRSILVELQSLRLAARVGVNGLGVERAIDDVLGGDRDAPRVVPMGANPPLFDGMQLDNDGPLVS